MTKKISIVIVPLIVAILFSACSAGSGQKNIVGIIMDNWKVYDEAGADSYIYNLKKRVSLDVKKVARQDDAFTVTLDVTAPDMSGGIKEYLNGITSVPTKDELNEKLKTIADTSALKTSAQTVTLFKTDDKSFDVEYSSGFVDALCGYSYQYFDHQDYDTLDLSKLDFSTIDDNDDNHNDNNEDNNQSDDNNSSGDTENYANFFDDYTKALISFIRTHKFVADTDYASMQLVYLDSDDAIDLALFQLSAGGGHAGLTNAYLYDNGTFREIGIEKDLECRHFQIVTDRNNNRFLTNGQLEKYTIGSDFYVPTVFGKAVVKNDTLCLEPIYKEKVNQGAINPDGYEPEEYLNIINEEYEFTNDPDEYRIHFYHELDKSTDSYVFKTSITDEEIKNLVSHYFIWDYIN